MDKKTGWIIAAIVAAFAVIIGISIAQQGNGNKNSSYNDIIPASEASGNIAELVNGDIDAPVKIIEYGDYQCTACAPMNPYINELIKKYDGKVAVVFRTMILDYHQNGEQAARAALAANEQGYWKEFKDILFENQDDWYYSEPAELTKQLEKYFTKVSNGKGDLEKFRTDQTREDFGKKLDFDASISKKQNVEWTPYFMIDGELISQRGISSEEFIEKLSQKIDKKLANLENN